MSVCGALGTAPVRLARPARAVAHHVPRPVWRRLPWWAELATITVFYAAYEVLRVLSPSRAGAALAHAGSVVRLEQALHLGVEATANHWLAGSSLWSHLAGYWYLTAHFAVTPVVLALAWWKAPAGYAALRSALVVLSFTALVVYWAWPLAPPRYAVAGTVDTLIQGNFFGAADAHGASGLVNEYAAMPSLHVGWAVWCAVSGVVLLRSRWRHLAWAYPLTMTAVVLSTGNHYLLDALAGLALALASVAVTRPATAVAAVASVAARPRQVAVDLAAQRAALTWNGVLAAGAGAAGAAAGGVAAGGVAAEVVAAAPGRPRTTTPDDLVSAGP